jgi:hypothetical protein
MNRKLAQMLLYVAEMVEGDPSAGKTKLHKILFFSDFEAFRKTGESISGENYVKYDQGPFLKPLDSTVNKMSNAGLAEWAPPNQRGEIRLVPRVKADVSLLTEQDRQILGSNVKRFWGMSASGVSNLSHRLFGWQTTPNDHEIPYNSAYVGDPRHLDSTETAWALALIGRYREWKRQRQEYCP